MAAYRQRAFEMIGEIMFEWGLLDQRVIGETWHARDPKKESAFVRGSIEPGFYRRLQEWARLHRPSCAPANLGEFEKFVAHVQNLSVQRDDLTHNVHGISEGGPEHVFGVHFTRRSFDPDAKWNQWLTKFLHLPPRARPPVPVHVEHGAYYRPQLATLLADIIQARGRIVEIGELHRSGRGF